MSIIRADSIKNRAGNGAPDFPNGITVTGVVTATTLNQNVTGNITVSGNVSVGGTLTYEDVKNVDSIGIITARNGIDCNGDIDVDGHTNLDNVNIVGVTTFSGNILPGTDSSHNIGSNGVRFSNGYFDTLYGDGSNLTGITQTTINSNAVERIITGSNTANTLNASTSLTYDGVYLAHTGTSFRITATDTNASNALNYIQFNAGKCEYHSDQNAAVGSSGHLFTTDGTYAVKINASGIYPATNNNFDLGSSSLRWANVYTQDLKLSNEAKKDEGGNDVDGTWGDYTIQEGESDLYLINNRNGKKYKFMLKEVN